MKKIQVTLNYDNWKKIILKVPADWTKAQITKVVLKKYGKIDFYSWVFLAEETVEA